MLKTLTGQVRDGVVVFEGPSPLAEGTRVEVRPIDMSESLAELSAILLEFAGTAEGLPPDMAEQHDHYLHGQPKR